MVQQPFRGASHERLIYGDRIVHVDDARAVADWAMKGEVERAFVERTNLRTSLFVPLRKEGALLGFISADRHEVRPFTDTQITLLESFAAQAVIAMENARLLDELRQRTDELAQRNTEYGERIEHQAATIDVLKAMSASPGDAQPVFDLIAERARDICGGYGVSVHEFDGSVLHLRAYTGVSDDPRVREASKRGTRRRYARGARGARDHGASDHPLRRFRCGPRAKRRAQHGESAVAVPMMRGNAPIGGLIMGSRERGGFSDSQIELLKTFAEQAVIAITAIRNEPVGLT